MLVAWPDDLVHSIVTAYHKHKHSPNKWKKIQLTIKTNKSVKTCESFFYAHRDLFIDDEHKQQRSSESLPEPSKIDKEKPVFSLQPPKHNIFFTIAENGEIATRAVWVHCHNPQCMKWRKLPKNLQPFFLSLPTLCPVDYVPTANQLTLLPSSNGAIIIDYRKIINAPYRCRNVVCEIDRKCCGDEQVTLQDIQEEWGGNWFPLQYYRTRSRIDFIVSLTHYMHTTNNRCDYPWIEGKPVDLYSLYTIVHQFGGAKQCDVKDGRWTEIYKLLKLPTSIGSEESGQTMRWCVKAFFAEL